MSAIISSTIPNSASATAAAAAVQSDAPVAVPAELTPQELFLNRFRSYPLVKSSREAFYSVPCTRTVANALKPSLLIVRNTDPIRTVMNQGDLLGLYTLDQLDHYIPSAKTLDLPALTDPITRPISNTTKFINDGITATNNNLRRMVMDPTRKAASDLRGSLTSVVYDANGKGIISSRADPIFKPLNEQLESGINRYFANIKAVPVEGSTSEMSRTWRILFNALFQIHEQSVPLESETLSAVQPVEHAASVQVN